MTCGKSKVVLTHPGKTLKQNVAPIFLSHSVMSHGILNLNASVCFDDAHPRGHAHMPSALRGEGVSKFLTKGRDVVWIWL